MTDVERDSLVWAHHHSSVQIYMSRNKAIIAATSEGQYYRSFPVKHRSELSPTVFCHITSLKQMSCSEIISLSSVN